MSTGETDLRPLTEGDLNAVIAVDSAAYGQAYTPAMIAHEKALLEWDRMLGAWDRPRLVGTLGTFSFDMTVPERRAIGRTVGVGGGHLRSVRIRGRESLGLFAHPARQRGAAW